MSENNDEEVEEQALSTFGRSHIPMRGPSFTYHAIALCSVCHLWYFKDKLLSRIPYCPGERKHEWLGFGE